LGESRVGIVIKGFGVEAGGKDVQYEWWRFGLVRVLPLEGGLAAGTQSLSLSYAHTLFPACRVTEHCALPQPRQGLKALNPTTRRSGPEALAAFFLQLSPSLCLQSFSTTAVSY